ncbi:MAG TPA: DUF3604 domain-containing protein [Candidatus Sulfotelmatobacter sp.]|nr:DUF3604 domain-containing protein [Candidatus Sulfotelmatobacter sp.]
MGKTTVRQQVGFRRWIIALTLAAVSVLQPVPDVRTQEPAPPAQDLAKAFPKNPPYSPYAGRHIPERVFWGDTHLHTSFSMDAGAFGCRLGPREAYRFAKGQEVTASSGQQARLARPLDFLVVADHSDGFGFFPLLMSGDPTILGDPQGRRWYDMVRSGQGVSAAIEIVQNFGKGTISNLPVPGTTNYQNAWQEIIKSADEANDPGRFTAFIGFEWTSNTAGNNLHRNILFRDDGTKASMVEPYTTQKPLGSDNPRDLWKWMTAYEQKTGGHVLAIAHNGNLSNGRMFPLIESFTGKPIDRDYAETRALRERIYEVTQIKGDGETHPFVSPNDEFANYERWDKGNLDLSEKKKPEMLEFEYARAALRNGLKLEQELGVNPYKFGMIGSTDAHTGLAAIDEDNFWGKSSNVEPSATRATHPWVKAGDKAIMGWEQTASGYAGVWATENTREALFDAMQRKEVYATTGPRMIVRFFGGWDFEDRDARTRNPADVGYSKGVPMGGDLSKALAGKSPTFLVAALKDPIGANLDSIQIIKGWLDSKGETHERIYDAVWSGDRKPDAKSGKLPPVGDTVDVPNATYTNTIGASELIKVWKDPEFDPAQRAFYYVRVLEIPTPRWTAYDANYFGITMPPEVPMKGQERAYTSPIWYTPGK